MKLAIFDFDGTLYRGQVVPELMKYYTQAQYPKLPYSRYMLKVGRSLLKYKLPFCSTYGKEHFRKDASIAFVRVFEGKDVGVMEGFFNDATQEVIKKLDAQVVQEVKRCKQEGYYCILLSGCYEPILKGVAQAIGIDQVIGSEVKWATDGQNKVKLAPLDVAIGNRKVEKLGKLYAKEKVDWEQSTAYGDSSYDRNILELVGKPVAVRPDEGLKVLAIQNKWRIID